MSAPKLYPQFEECTDTKYVSLGKNDSGKKSTPIIFNVGIRNNSPIGQSNLSKTLLGVGGKGIDLAGQNRNSISKYKRKNDPNFFLQLIFIVGALIAFGYFLVDENIIAMIAKNL